MYFGPRDKELEDVLRSALLGGGMRPMHMDDSAARVLAMLVALSGARQALEIGTYFGWSAIHMCRVLGEGGTLVSLEIDREYAQLAKDNLQKLGLTNCHVLTSDAVEFMGSAAIRGEQFDFVFIDGAKRQYLKYLRFAFPLLRPGGLLVADDCFADGDYSAEEGGQDAASRAIHRYVRAVTSSPKLTSYLIPTKHGLLVSRKQGDRSEAKPISNDG